MNLTSGAATLIAPFASVTLVRDLAAPIPESGGLALVALGTGMIALMRRQWWVAARRTGSGDVAPGERWLRVPA